MELSRKAVVRLRTLIKFMEKLPKSAQKHFDFNVYFEQELPQPEDLIRPCPVPLWGSENDPKYLKWEKELDKAQEKIDKREVTGRIKKTDLMHGCGTTACALGWATVVPQFRGLKMDADYFYLNNRQMEPFEAARKFFDIDSEDEDQLFGGGNESTTQQWAKMARKYIKEKYGVQL